jgi:hypothetical protein
VAIKSMNGKGATTITIHAIGVVKEVADGKVYIEWKFIDMNRQVPSKGSKGAFGTIQGPYNFSDSWTRQVFSI